MVDSHSNTVIKGREMRSKCRAEVVKILSRQKGIITITMGKFDSNKGMWTSTAKEENCLFVWSCKYDTGTENENI